MSDEAEDKGNATPPAKDTAKDTAQTRDSDKAKGDGKHFKAGVAVGIGSAAIVAALLYARTGKKPDKK
jgi:hypothetical protein